MFVPSVGVMHDFTQPLPWSVPAGQYYGECLELIVEAERLGYDAVWLSEHHGRADGFVPSPLVAAAAIAARTSRIRIGTNVVLLPLHHPLRVAEDGAVVHALSNGRLVLGVGQGYAPHEFALFGVNPKQRPSRFEDGIAVLRRTWGDGRTGFEGRRFTLPDGPFSPTPAGPAPIYIGAVSPTAVDRAVRLGDGLIVYVTELAAVADRYAVLREAMRRHGRVGFPFVLTGVAYVARDAEEAWAQAGPALARLESGLRGVELTADHLDREAYLVGTPQEVAARLTALHAEVPFDHFAFWGRLPGITVDQARDSMTLLAAVLFS
jgi:alkanesulfonate monooxygenase SsuD/methylene tetrahydromethanopterin reductase-like flavin-dependent oxidoreductase (luciferase family)